MNCPYCQSEPLHEGRVSCHNCGRTYPVATGSTPQTKGRHYFLLQGFIIVIGAGLTFYFVFSYGQKSRPNETERAIHEMSYPELHVPSDPHARFYIIEKSGTGNERVITTNRVSRDNNSYSKRLYNCREKTVKYLGSGDTLAEMNVSPPDPKMGPITGRSIAYYVGLEACK
jgi:hypothetical protein